MLAYTNGENNYSRKKIEIKKKKNFFLLKRDVMKFNQLQAAKLFGLNF